MEEWLISYREFSDVDLQNEIAWLRTQTRNPYNTQTEGGRSYARSTAEFRDRLAAATQAQKERGNVGPRHGIADFSNVKSYGTE